MSAGGLKLIESEPASLHADIVNQLRDFIVEGHLAPGTRIPERELCDRFDISRTPLREALKVLAAECEAVCEYLRDQQQGESKYDASLDALKF